jgi:phosphate transport system substrate-binding protein
MVNDWVFDHNTKGNRLMRTLLLTIVFALIVLAAHPTWAGQVVVHGSTTVANDIIVPHKAEIEQRSGQQLVIVGSGSQRGIFDLVSDRAQIAMISAPLAEVARKVDEKTPGAVDATRLKAYQIGEGSVAFAVHQTNRVRTLTDLQLADIFRGKIGNWRELEDADIIIVAALPGDGLRTMVEDELIDSASLPSSTRAMPNATQVAKIVSQLPGAIGVVAPAGIGGSVTELRADRPIAQPLVLVTASEERADIRCVVEVATSVGNSSNARPPAGAEMGPSCAH